MSMVVLYYTPILFFSMQRCETNLEVLRYDDSHTAPFFAKKWCSVTLKYIILQSYTGSRTGNAVMCISLYLVHAVSHWNKVPLIRRHTLSWPNKCEQNQFALRMALQLYIGCRCKK